MLRNTFIQQGCNKVIKNNSEDIKAHDKAFVLQIYVCYKRCIFQISEGSCDTETRVPTVP